MSRITFDEHGNKRWLAVIASVVGLMVAGAFMVMNSDARHRKEFSTENALGGDFVLPRHRSS
jgi:hypothetical protein